MIFILDRVALMSICRFKETIVNPIKPNIKLNAIIRKNYEKAKLINQDSIIIIATTFINKIQNIVSFVMSSSQLNMKYIVIVPLNISISAPYCSCANSPSVYCKHIFSCFMKYNINIKNQIAASNGCQLYI